MAGENIGETSIGEKMKYGVSGIENIKSEKASINSAVMARQHGVLAGSVWHQSIA